MPAKPGIEAATNVRVSLESRPTHVLYRSELLGAERMSIRLVVTNDGARDVAAEDLVVRFRAKREGVEFPCGEAHVTEREHEPGVLLPGQSHTFRREIDCSFSLPGRYDVEVFVGVGRSEPAHSVGGLALVVDPGRNPPHPLPALPGVYAIMVGSDVVAPLTQEAWGESDYRVALVIINGSHETVHVKPKARLTFLTFKKGSPLPCSGDAEPIELGWDIQPGRYRTARVALACAPSEVGRYEVLGRLTLDGETTGTDVGHYWLNVEPNPLFDSPPEPPYIDRSGRVLW